MDLQNVEAVVRRLFSDSEFQATVNADPEAAFASYQLSGDEHEALRKLCARMADGEEIGASPLGLWF